MGLGTEPGFSALIFFQNFNTAHPYPRLANGFLISFNQIIRAGGPGESMSSGHLGLHAMATNPSRRTVSAPAAPLFAPRILALFVPPILRRQVKLQVFLALADSSGKVGSRDAVPGQQQPIRTPHPECRALCGGRLDVLAAGRPHNCPQLRLTATWPNTANQPLRGGGPVRLGYWPERGAQPMLKPWALRLRPLRRLGAALAWGDWTGWRSRDGLGAEKRAGPRGEPTRQVRSSLQELGAWRHLGDHSEGLVRPMGRNPRDTQTSRGSHRRSREKGACE